MTNPIICALDTETVERAVNLAEAIKNDVGALKLGLEFFTSNGPEGIQAVSKVGLPIFLDLKFHDIPNTVARAVYAATALDVFMLTVHTSGGKAMMQTCVQSAYEASKVHNTRKPLIVGVTVLTSFDQEDLTNVNVQADLKDHVGHLASLAYDSGLDGIVCSAHELAQVKEACGQDFKTVVPGIRPAGEATHDQKRTVAPSEAMDMGADYLVIGRAITQHAEPGNAAREIAASII